MPFPPIKRSEKRTVSIPQGDGSNCNLELI